jgi:hypothetical protein
LVTLDVTMATRLGLTSSLGAILDDEALPLAGAPQGSLDQQDDRIEIGPFASSSRFQHRGDLRLAQPDFDPIGRNGYVPISGGDDSAAIDPKYECCKGRGAIVALDAATGATIWKTYTIPEARPLGRNSIGTQLWGPSGVAVWSSPTIDAKRRMLYAGTGDNHSAPATDGSDAVLAVSLDSGEIVWFRQLLVGDMGNAACLAVDKANCPEPHGPDFDLGASANLITLPNGRRLLTIGQKSGMVWALDPDDRGRIVWQARVGRGGPLGGVQWGSANAYRGTRGLRRGEKRYDGRDCHGHLNFRANPPRTCA